MDIHIVHSNFISKKTRRDSYPHTYAELSEAINEFADAGFFFSRKNYILTTFCCGKNYTTWDLFVDPHDVHWMLNPNCYFVKIALGR